jgi:hypothetical protein
VFGYLAKSGMERAKNILNSAGVPFFMTAINSKVKLVWFLVLEVTARGL